MEDDTIRQRQVLVYNNADETLEIELQYSIKQKPVVLGIRKEQFITVNICNAAEKIEEYSEAIQKLVWRALQYRCDIEVRQSISPTTTKHYEKIAKYIEAFNQTQKLVEKICKRKNLPPIIIENKMNNIYGGEK